MTIFGQVSSWLILLLLLRLGFSGVPEFWGREGGRGEGGGGGDSPESLNLLTIFSLEIKKLIELE